MSSAKWRPYCLSLNVLTPNDSSISTSWVEGISLLPPLQSVSHFKVHQVTADEIDKGEGFTCTLQGMVALN